MLSRSATDKSMWKWFQKKHQRQFDRGSEQQAAEKLAQIGTHLRQKRQELGLALEQVAIKTCIRQQLLQALEAGQLDQLPEPIYIQNLIKQYANSLGLDGTALSETFPTEDRRLNLKKPSWIGLPAAQLQPIHLYLLYILVIVGAVNALSGMLNRSQLPTHRQQEQPLVASIDQPDQTLPQQPENLKPVSIKPVDTKDDRKTVRVEVALKAESWLRVIADGKTQFEGVLPAGTQRTWVAQKEVTVRAGNAGGVLVTLNQQPAKQMGNLGEVQEVTFAAQRLLTR